MSPVNFAFAKHDDGSASVTVGNIDRVYGMEWTVELILRPKSTVLEERVTLNNRSDVRHRFYWWNNAGVEAWDDSRIVYPMRFAATHGFTEIHPGPSIRTASIYSLIRNHTKGPVSMFVHGSREPFMGVWNPHTNTGTVHFADYEDFRRRKSGPGESTPTGSIGARLSPTTTADMSKCRPDCFAIRKPTPSSSRGRSLQFSEYWMPVREIGGISRANLAGVASLVRAMEALIAGFNANQAIPQATISISNGNQQVSHEKTDLAPERTWTHEVPNADARRSTRSRSRTRRASFCYGRPKANTTGRRV